MAHPRSIFAAVATLTLACSAAPASAAVIDNGSFEDIVLDWAANPALVYTPGEWQHRNQFGQADKLYTAVDGALFGVIEANPNTTPNTIIQTFTTTGGLFSGVAAFLGQDSGVNDYGYVRLYQGLSFIELFYSDIATVGPFGYTEWTSFSTVLAAGVYTLEAGVANDGDGFLPSYLLVDNFTVAEVPEPSTWALMIAGFGLAGAALRRRQTVAA